MYLCRFQLIFHGIVLKRSKLRHREYGGSLGSISLSYVCTRTIPTGHLRLCMYSCILSILWEIRPPAPTCQAFSCGYIRRRSEGSPLGKYRGKRFICTYYWVEGFLRRGGVCDKKKKKQKMYICMYICMYMYNTKVEFSDSLGDSEVVRVLGNNVILHITKWALVQAPTSGPVKMHVDSQSLSASRSKRHFTPVGRRKIMG